MDCLSDKTIFQVWHPLFLSFAYIVSDAGMARKFPFKNKKLVQIPL